MGLPVPSATTRFLQKFGFALLWAGFFGATFGAMAYYRLPPSRWGDERWFERPLVWLERLELALYDWRAEALGAASTPSDRVVLVGIDDETLANARADASWALATHPWPREVVGRVVEEVLREGTEAVLVDLPLADMSPHACAPGGIGGDDEK